MGRSSVAKKKDQAPQVPGWVGEYFRQAYDSHERLLRVISISRRGIGSVTAMPRLTKALAKVQGKEEDPRVAKLIEEDAALAKSEYETDFPVLHSLAVVALWSWLEHLVKGLLVERIVHDRTTLQLPAFQKLKLKLSDYLSLTKREQAAYLVELLEQEASSTLKRGVNRFETLLDPLRLASAVSESTAKSIFELQQVRNAIAHQNGRCDRRLKSNCPWLKLKLGEPIAVSSKQLDSYATAAAEYSLDVLYRIGDHHGVNLRESKE
jgi:hypothetical protein